MAISSIISAAAVGKIHLMDETKRSFDKTYMTEETEEIRERRKQQAIEAQKCIQDKIKSK